MVNDVTKLMAEFHTKQQLSIPEPRFAAIQFLNMAKGECWMRVEFNTKKQISEAEINSYLKASVALFIKGYSL
jgi:TetR/AcrR family transcriptional repressor of mexJK operon